VRQRHDRLRGRAMGPPLDHVRHQRVALALAPTRLMTAKFPYYLLADSEDGWRKEMEASGKFILRVERATSPLRRATCPTRLHRARPPPPLLPAGCRREQAGCCSTQGWGDLKRGFVYRRVPHITLKAIANNEEIGAIHAEFAPKLERPSPPSTRL